MARHDANGDGVLDQNELKNLLKEVKGGAPRKRPPSPSPVIDLCAEPSPMKKILASAASGIAWVKDGPETLANSKAGAAVAAATAVKTIDHFVAS